MLPAPALFFLLQTLSLLLICSAQTYYYCYNKAGNYTLNSPYAKNLDAALPPLLVNIEDDGFVNSTSIVFDKQDRVNAVALCRADVQLIKCRACIQNLTSNIREACPNQKQAIEWEDSCMVRYSNATIVGVMDTLIVLDMWQTENPAKPTPFMNALIRLLNDLSDLAAKGGPKRKVGAGYISGREYYQYIFALVECTPDLSSKDCVSCLSIGVKKLTQTKNPYRSGGRVMYPSCNLRYETYPFYNRTRLLELGVLYDTTETPPAAGYTNRNSPTRTIIIAVVVPVVVCLISAVSVYVFFKNRMKRMQEERREILESIKEMSKTESLKYSLRTIRAATSRFSDDNKLGQGGFGAVYKGILSNGQEIAVKRLSVGSGQGGDEFKNEVLLLARLQHRNLVKLLGFCLEGTEKLLIYQYVQNASLDYFIFDPTKRSLFDWEKLYKIISGIARGILYLHEDSQLRIIHRDLKPSNVLLDGEMKPKIADFGMARLFDQDETQECTGKIAGTRGYMAPEYITHGQFSVKTDVFSFGVITLEIISGKKNSGLQRGDKAEDLLSLAWKNWNEGTMARMVDPCLGSSFDSMGLMQRCIHIGLLCVQAKPNDRPNMTSVVMMLNSPSLVLAAPTKPAFYMYDDYVSDISLLDENISIEYGSSSRRSTLVQREMSSRNDVSFTEIGPR